MLTQTQTTHVCQHCGRDFTHRYYSERINHSNHSDWWNTNCSGNRFEEAKTKEEKISWLLESIGMEESKYSFDHYVENFECVLNLFESDSLENGPFNDAAAYMKTMRKELKNLYNRNIQEEIDDLEDKHNQSINRLKAQLI